ncbi:phage antirepressor N-terminal domain-containing protein [Fimbriiglobus ruber]|uniref:Antirepressor protein ant N-terminal domain-containing protein n=1 Tax=Fimbriiglobus ruber TaxID=1908690 RepID=A0A225DAG4_9BACT|nr:phage antirepressor N-terminal domain-containing protein [Fimbriiglobus ruber]OWK34286.1 hypothetical protein FRUB_10257 [Fimbriiglobus ruber]
MAGYELVPVKFHDDVIDAVKLDDGEIFVSVRRVCESFSISPQGQQERLKKKPWARIKMILIRDARGHEQEAVMIPRERVAMWLATLDVNRVAKDKPELVKKIELYQNECADVLHAHFFGPKQEPTPSGMTAQQIALIVIETVKQVMAAIDHSRSVRSITRFTVAERCHHRRLTTTTKQRGKISRLASHLLLLRFGEVPDKVGGWLVWDGPQVNCLDDAIDRIMDEVIAAERQSPPARNLFSDLAGMRN